MVVTSGSLKAQKVIYVDVKAAGAYDGSSWKNAFTNIEDAISDSQIGDSIFVAKGTYKPYGSGVNATYNLPAGRLFFGGFAGNESKPNQRKLQTNKTYLDGDIGTVGVASDNCRFVVTLNNLTSTLVLDGFSIVNGYAYSSGSSITYGGGGLRITGSKVNLNHCSIHDNYTGMRGGGIYADNSTLNINDCLIFNNATGNDVNSMGGAVFMNSGTLNIKRTRFNSNQARRGGAISTNSTKINIDRTVFAGNESSSGIHTLDVGDKSSLELYNSLFTGATDCIYISPFYNINAHRIAHCTFAENAHSGSSTMVVVVNEKTEVYNCIFWNRGNAELYGSSVIIPTVKNCIVKGGYEWGKNIYTGKPEFVKSGANLSLPFDADTLNYNLTQKSAGINQGNDSFVYSSYPYDLAGNARVQGGQSDLGACESPWVFYHIALTSSHPGAATFKGPGTYAKDSVVTLKVQNVSACYSFVHWKEGTTVVGTDTVLSFKADKNRSIVAVFAQKQFQVTLGANPAEGGSPTASGTYNCNDSVRTFRARPDSCYIFVNWTSGGKEVSVQADYSLKPTSNLDLIAHYKPRTIQLNALASPSGGGTVTGGGAFPCNDSLRIFEAIPGPCYEFINWTSGAKVLSDKAVFASSFKNSQTLTANFRLKTFKVQLVSVPSNGGTLTGFGQYGCGSEATAKATGNSGFVFEGWRYNGNPVSTQSTYTFAVQSDLTLEAHFKTSGGMQPYRRITGTLYPNPGNGKVYLNHTGLTAARIFVYNSSGLLVWSSINHHWSQPGTELDLSRLECGVYWIKLEEGGRTGNWRYIKTE